MFDHSAESCAVVHAALDQLRGRFVNDVVCEYRDGILTLRGCTHSFYQKQLAQEVVRALDGVEAVVNEIVVNESEFEATGLSEHRFT